MRPTNLSTFHLPTHRLERACNALVDLIERHWSVLAACAIFAIYAGVSDAEYQELVAAETAASREAEELAIAQRDEAADWNRAHRVRVVLEGDARQVATLAGQVAMVIQ